MPNSFLDAARYPASSAAPNVPQDIENAVLDLEDDTIPYFATSGARDTAFSNWVNAGNTMRDGLHCFVQGTGLMEYIGSAWVATTKTLYRRVGGTATGTLASGVSANLCPAQSIPAAPFGQGVGYTIDVDAVAHASSIPSGLGWKLELNFDGTLQDGAERTNGGTSAVKDTLHARAGMTVADNSAHTVTAVITSEAGTITLDTAYARLLLLIRPYVLF